MTARAFALLALKDHGLDGRRSARPAQGQAAKAGWWRHCRGLTRCGNLGRFMSC